MTIVEASAAVAALDRLGVARQRMTLDSRSIKPGDVFVAIPGSRVDGRQFIRAALDAGAAAVLQEATGADATISDARVLGISNLAAQLGHIAGEFYAHPAAAMRVFGVTGTNGKTSITNWLMQAYGALGMRCAAIGTLGVTLGEREWLTSNTTPDAVHLQTILRDLREAGAEAVAMEVSSHALELGRVQGMRFDAAIFTNLTQDHLDFHGSMVAYGAAKAKLFTDYPARHRIINADDAFGRELIQRQLPGTISYGLYEGAVRGTVRQMRPDGMHLNIDYAGQKVEVNTPLIGRFNASNLLAVAAALVADGVELCRAGAVLATLVAAPGRMQNVAVDGNAGPRVYVDYAHTPDALAKALETVRETRPAAMAVVFGCGGNRDRSKRPQMGRIAADRADRVYVTSDNPRNEDPGAIVADILDGIPTPARARTVAIVDRSDAIQRAIASAAVGDAILIAGKGHEDYQEVAGVRSPFSDVQHARTALLAWRGTGQHDKARGDHVGG